MICFTDGLALLASILLRRSLARPALVLITAFSDRHGEFIETQEDLRNLVFDAPALAVVPTPPVWFAPDSIGIQAYKSKRSGWNGDLTWGSVAILPFFTCE